jgi:hypothetical protein
MITGKLMFDVDIEVVNEEALQRLTGEIITNIKRLDGVHGAEEVDCDIIDDDEDESSESPE